MDNKELSHLLGTMDIPSHRASNFNKKNIQWLYQNISKRNSDHPKYSIVMRELTRRVENNIFDN